MALLLRKTRAQAGPISSAQQAEACWASAGVHDLRYGCEWADQTNSRPHAVGSRRGEYRAVGGHWVAKAGRRRSPSDVAGVEGGWTRPARVMTIRRCSTKWPR